MEAGRIYYPEDKIPLARLLPMGLQHVVAMFGATVLAPVIMGFDPQTALFFSGIGTMIFILITRFKVPSYLGSSFTFIGPVLAVKGSDAGLIPEVLCGIMGAAVLYGLAAAVTLRYGPAWIDRLMPPIVTGTVVALIGLNLASSSIENALNKEFVLATQHDLANLTIATVTFLAAALGAVYLRGFLKLIPILIGVIVGWTLAALLGQLDPAALEKLRQAPWLGLPHFVTPRFSWHALLVISPLFIVLVAENKGHIAAISGYMKRDLNPHLGRAYLGDAVATFVSAMGGGTPQTTYAENMGVMAITRVFSIYNFIAASCMAMLLGVCPKFGAFVSSIPTPVLGGVTIILYGLITLMGVKIWLDAKVNLAEHRNLVVAGASLTLATGLGIKGITVGGLNLSGIAIGTLAALLLNLMMSFGAEQPSEATH
jgi:uracil-xanthine permease